MILYLDPRRDARDAITDELGSDLAVEWVPAPSALDAVLEDRGDTIDVLVIGSSVSFEDALRTAEHVATAQRHIGVLVLANTIGTQELRRALRAGVLDVLDEERTEGELRGAVERALTRRAQRSHDDVAEHTGGIVLVFSTKGGCGTSVIASNLAVALAERSDDGVGLVDLALSSGDLAIMLQLLPAWSVHDVALQGARLDREALQGYLTQHEASGVSLLAAPTDPAAAEQVTPESVQHLLTLMRTLFPITIVDTPSYFSDQLLAAIDVADEIVVVSSLDVPSVKNLKIALQTLEVLHVNRDRIRIVLNRSDSAVGLRAAEVERSLGTSVDVQMPSSRDVPLSVNQGTPIWLSKRRSSVADAIDGLAGDMAARFAIGQQAEDHRRRRRLRRR